MIFYENCEIGELILLCRERDDSAFDELVQRYTPMMRKVISGFDSSGLDPSELFSEACVALHLAAQKYDLNQKEIINVQKTKRHSHCNNPQYIGRNVYSK